MKKTTFSFEQVVEKLKESMHPNTDDLKIALGGEEYFHYYSYYGQDSTRYDYCLIYSQNGIAYFPVENSFFGNGWHRLYLAKAKLISISDVPFLKDAKEALSEDVTEFEILFSENKINCSEGYLTTDVFINGFSFYGIWTEESLAKFVQRNNAGTDSLFLKSALPDSKYLGYFFVQLKTEVLMIPYYCVASRNQYEQIDPGGIRVFTEKDKAYLQSVIKDLKKGQQLIEKAVDKQKIRQLFQ